MIAVELGVTHWFYLYIVWFFPVTIVALLAAHPEHGESATSPQAAELVPAMA